MEAHLFRSWNTLPCNQSLKPKFQFQTPLAQKFPNGTLELVPFGANSDLCCNFPDGTLALLLFGANSDLPWDWKSRRFLIGDSSVLSLAPRNYLILAPTWILVGIVLLAPQN